MQPHITWSGKVWKYKGPAGWYFVYLSHIASKKVATAVAKGMHTVGFSFVPVTARVGNSSWKTTLFPTKEGVYLLAIKAAVRKKEKIDEGDVLRITCTLENKNPAPSVRSVSRRK